MQHTAECLVNSSPSGRCTYACRGLWEASKPVPTFHAHFSQHICRNLLADVEHRLAVESSEPIIHGLKAFKSIRQSQRLNAFSLRKRSFDSCAFGTVSESSKEIIVGALHQVFKLLSLQTTCQNNTSLCGVTQLCETMTCNRYCRLWFLAG